MGVVRKIRHFLFPPVFTIIIEQGVARAARGTITRKFLDDCGDVAKQLGIYEGEIYGKKSGNKITLEFSGNIPQSAHQRFRNLWGVHNS